MTEPAPQAGALEHSACALCGSRELERVLEGADLRRHVPGRFRVVRCRVCRLAFVDPRPTVAAIARYYPADYAPHDLAPAPLVERAYYAAFRRPGVEAGARVLDVGCGGGRYLRFLAARGYRAVGTDVDPVLAARVSRETGLPVHAGALPEIALEPASFDLVTLWWVLEHTHDPIATLRAAHRALRPGGRLIVSVQNFASLARRLFGRYWHHLDLPGHLYQFEPATLRAALERAGFAVERIRQDAIGKDFAPSLGYALGLQRSLDTPLLGLASLPFDLLCWALGRASLITAYARS